MPRSAIAFAVLPVLVPSLLSAAEIHVPADQPSLGAALTAAAANDTITIDAGSYSEHDLTIPASLAGLLIRSKSPERGSVTLDASGGTRGITNLASGVVLERIGIWDAAGTGLWAEGDASMVLDGCFFHRCGGGGARVDRVEATWTTFDRGTSTDSTLAGGLTAVEATVTNCAFRLNAGVQGGAIRVVSGSLLVDDTYFATNSATEDGGAVYVENASYGITNSMIRGSSASVAGGAIYAENGDPGGPHLVSDCEILFSSANLLGGAIHVRNLPAGKTADFTRVIVSGDPIIGSGGGLSIRECTANVTESTFTGNGASQGGAIHVADGTLNLHASILAFNQGGAAVICEGVSTATASCTDIFGNTGGDWIACLSGQSGSDGNLSVDPEFCSLEPQVDEDFRLQPGSPLLDPPGCPRMGAAGAGCFVPVERLSWGALKRRFGN